MQVGVAWQQTAAHSEACRKRILSGLGKDGPRVVATDATSVEESVRQKTGAEQDGSGVRGGAMAEASGAGQSFVLTRENSRAGGSASGIGEGATAGSGTHPMIVASGDGQPIASMQQDPLGDETGVASGGGGGVGTSDVCTQHTSMAPGSRGDGQPAAVSSERKRMSWADASHEDDQSSQEHKRLAIEATQANESAIGGGGADWRHLWDDVEGGYRCASRSRGPPGKG